MNRETRIVTETSSIYLRELASAMGKGKLGVPLFQRDFVWTRRQVIELFDSIKRGYPIGSFLLWKLDGDWEGSKDAISGKVDEEAKPTWYILDGLQRLTSFYGCLTEIPGKDKIFNLQYDLNTKSFGYFSNSRPHIMPVSTIYDTFSLLDKLDEIRNSYPQEKAKAYIDEAKRLNALLQEYAVSRIVIEQCNLDEATEAFARLNSEGTTISRPYMMQALAYRKSGEKPLMDLLDELALELVPYAFESIKSEDLLNCFFIFEDKKFFDISLKDYQKLEPRKYESEVRQALLKTVEFLHNYCKIESWNLLPYRNQFQSLIWWFRKHPESSIDEKNELRKWFYYTTANLIYQNTSLGYVRKLFSGFEDFVDGKSESPINYDIRFKDIEIDFGYQHNSARTRLLITALCDNYRSHSSDANLRYQKSVKYGEWGKAESYFPIMRDEDITELNRIFIGNKQFDDEELAKYALDRKMVNDYRMGFDFDYQKRRAGRLKMILNGFVKRYL